MCQSLSEPSPAAVGWSTEVWGVPRFAPGETQFGDSSSKTFSKAANHPVSWTRCDWAGKSRHCAGNRPSNTPWWIVFEYVTNTSQQMRVYFFFSFFSLFFSRLETDCRSIIFIITLHDMMHQNVTLPLNRNTLKRTRGFTMDTGLALGPPGGLLLTRPSDWCCFFFWCFWII